jgi:hypothetical protein
MIGGGLFSRYYLDEGVRQGRARKTVHDAEVEAFTCTVRPVIAEVPASGNLREAQTGTVPILRMLSALGWLHPSQQEGNKRRQVGARG